MSRILAHRWVLVSCWLLACGNDGNGKDDAAAGAGTGGNAATTSEAGDTNSGGTGGTLGGAGGGAARAGAVSGGSGGGTPTGGAGGAGGAGGSSSGAGGATGGAGGAGGTGGGGAAGLAGSGATSGHAGGAGAAGAAPTTEPLACLKSVVVGYDYMCAVNGTGNVLCWGKGATIGNGDTLDKSTPTLVKALDAPARAVFGGYGENLAFLENDKTFRWGRVSTVTHMDVWPTPRDATSFLPEAITVGVGASHHCVLREDHTVACWGANSYGQLGTGDSTSSDTLVPVSSLASVSVLAVGYEHNCALKDDGTVWCWGLNDLGQLGLGTYDDASVPTQLTSLGSRVTHLATRHEYSCAVLDDGTVSCWGREAWADNVGNPNPTVIEGLEDVALVALGDFHVCALKTDDSLWCWYLYGASTGDNAVPSHTPAPIEEFGTDVKTLLTGYDSTCVFRKDDSFWCFGNDLGFTLTPTQVAPGCN